MAQDDESSSDESLDLTSEKFDPFKALYSAKTVLPVANAPTYDNVIKWESIVKGISAKPAGNKRKVQQSSTVKQETSQSEAKSELSILNYRNVLAKMENAIGPLQLLHHCMETKTRVKVYTRSAKGIRGHVEAYVVAFDKHWNLALQDCMEVWKRKVKRKVPALQGLLDKKNQSSISDEDIQQLPKVILKESNGKYETLERHVPQMMLRGEQVVLIIKIDQ